MSKSVATESKEGHKSPKTGGKRGAGDEGNENEEGILVIPPIESLTILTTDSTVSTMTDQFMFTDDFKRLLVGLVMGHTLVTLRLATKAWKCVADAFISSGVESGVIIIIDGKHISFEVCVQPF